MKTPTPSQKTFRKRGGGLYSQYEIDTIKKFYKKKTAKDIAGILNLSIHQVNNLKRELGLTKVKKLTDKDLDVIKKLYGTTSAKELGKMLGVSQYTINRITPKLGLRKRRTWTADEKREVCRLYGQIKTSEIAARFGSTANVIVIIARQGTKDLDKDALFERQGGHCAGCLDKFESSRHLEIDHRQSLRDAGNSQHTNCQLLCPNCNKSKGRRDNNFLYARLAERGILTGKQRDALIAGCSPVDVAAGRYDATPVSDADGLPVGICETLNADDHLRRRWLECV